jgi:hypothetical protein
MANVSDPHRMGTLTRRRVLKGAGSAVLASLAPTELAGARPLFLGSASTGTTGTPLQASLVFPDGKSITVTQNQATDIGTFVNAPISQRCFRYYVTGYGDYRDAIVIDFRPETDGSREEVVFWFGCFYNFDYSPPRPLGLATPINMFVANSTALTKTGSGTGALYGGAGTSGRLQAATAYVWPDGGVGTLSPNSAQLSGLKVDDQITVTKPDAIGGATHYNVYTPYDGPNWEAQNFLYLQNASPIPIGTDWVAAPGDLRTDLGLFLRKSTSTVCTVTISGGTKFTTPVVTPVRNWWWNSRFRIQSAPRPVVRTNADLVAQKSSFPQTTDPALRFGAPDPSTFPVYPWTEPMGTGGLSVFMQSAAVRKDIGPETEWFAAWRATGDAGCLTTALANAEAVGSMPIHYADSTTGAPVDTDVRIGVSINPNAGAGYWIAVQAVQGGCLEYIAFDAAHHPNCAIEGWHLTKDPYYLEEAQFVQNRSILAGNYARFQPSAGDTAHPLPSLLSINETRAFAWSLRGLFHLVKFQTMNTPSWMLSRSQILQIEADNKIFMQRFLDNAANLPMFGQIIHPAVWDAFMCDFMTSSLCLAVYCGLSDYLPFLETQSTLRLAMTDATGTSGWDNRYPTPYYFDILDARLTSGWPGYGTDSTLTAYTLVKTANTPTSIAELWADFQVQAAAHNWGSGTNSWQPVDTWTPDMMPTWTTVYLMPALDQLARLSHCGIAGAADNFALLARRMQAQFPTYTGDSSYKWSTAVAT